MPNITITASANSTPPANTIVATCQLAGGQHVQQFMMTDGANVAVVDSASRLLVSASIVNSASVIVSSGSAVITNQVSASISNSPSVVVSSGSAVVTSGSVIITNQVSASISNSPSVIVSSGSVVVTNALSASISGGSVALLAGVNAIGSVVVTNLAGSAAGSPLFITQNNMTGSAAGSPIFSSITNLAGSAAGSPLFVSVANSPSVIVASGSVVITNQISASISNSPSVIISSGSVVVTNALSASVSGGSVALLAGANVVGSASVIQSTPTGIGNAWPVKITDGTDTVAVNSASLLQVAVSAASVNIVDTAGNQFGVAAASPLYVTGGGTGGTTATDRAGYAEGTTNFTPVGGFFSTNPIALTACQSGAARMTANRAVHTNLRDGSGNELGTDATSPLFVSACLTNRAGSAAGSPLFVSVTNSPSVIVASGSMVVTNLLSASISNSPSVVVSSGSVVVTNALSASISNSPSVVVSSGSVVVTNPVSASISNTVTITGSGFDADKGIFSEGATWFNPIGGFFFDTAASLTACQMAAVRLTPNRAQHVNLRDNNGSQLGAGTASPFYSSITNLAGSAAGSPLFTSVTNIVSASIGSGSVALLAGANIFGSASVIQSTPTGIANAWPVKITDGSDNALVDAASRLLTSASIVNSPSVIVSSGSLVVTNALSASISNSPSVIVSSGSVVVTNALSASLSGGSVALLAGANIIGSASVIQSTPTGLANAWPVTLANSGSAYGVSGSPLAVAQDVKNLWFAGSLVAASTLNLSASVSGCTRIVASAAGKAILVLAATYVTSNSQNIGWVASGAGAASVLIQSPMPFAQFGGMDANRHPGTLWEFPSGSNAVLTTTSACIVAGTITYIQVAS